MKKKHIIVVLTIITTAIIIFIQIAYKLLNSGNNINKSDDNDILNIKSYEAIVDIEIYSNKNRNKYVISQKYVEPNIFKQEVIEPENIKGFITIFDGENFIIENKNLNLRKTYENFNYIKGNSLSLISFVEEYKASTEIEETETEKEKEVKFKIMNSANKYEMYKKIYISKNTNLPTRMEILDINQNRTVYILYREININKTSKEEILAD